MKFILFILAVFGNNCLSCELFLKSDFMQKDVPVSIFLPASYSANVERFFPVIYLLHGAGDDHKKWFSQTNIEQLANKDDVIIVCPDGGKTSWYFDSPIDKNYRYESFICGELIEYIDRSYRTVKDRSHRWIAGASMGGHGALFLSLRHPSKFSAAISFSGATDLFPYPKNWDIELRLGPRDKNPSLWKDMSVLGVLKNLKRQNGSKIFISITCGLGDFFLEDNRRLVRALTLAGLPHLYHEGVGDHGWIYWQSQLLNQWNLLMQSRKDLGVSW